MYLASYKARPVYALYHYFWSTLDWIYPPTCGGCDQLGVRWCSGCHEQTIRIDNRNCCPRCGLDDLNNGVCPSCIENPPICTAIRSWGAYDGPLREAVHRVKYKQDLGLTELFSSFLFDLLVELDWNVNLITSVPLSRKRLRQRGYNQAALLGWPVAVRMDIRYSSRAVERTRDTASQVNLSAKERLQNVVGAFHANPEVVKYKNVLVVDDVITTGATIQSCAQALLAAGANQVFGLSLARTLLHSDQSG
jgi:competence protein ComFC